MNNFRPELLSPAGSLEKLKVAVNYGADAVYLGGEKFGLRQAADNFTTQELKEAVGYAHQRNVLVYVVINSFLHNEDLEELPEFINLLNKLNVDAMIVSDLGVVNRIKELSEIPIHLSTQASCLNVQSAKFWKKMGVTRVVLGREVSIEEAGQIKKEAGIEVEMFIHGAMCMAYSGNCTISNYTAGRDSNRGGCAQSCRFEYEINDLEGNKKNSFFMSSKDLEGIQLLPHFVEHEIDSLKVEGRMKSHLYAASVSKVYSEAVKLVSSGESLEGKDLNFWQNELDKFIHRDYCTGSLIEPAKSDSIFSEREFSKEINYIVIGHIIEVVDSEFAILEVRNAFDSGDSVELMPFSGTPIVHQFNEIENLSGENLLRTNPSTLVKIPYYPGIERWNLVRKKVLQ